MHQIFHQIENNHHKKETLLCPIIMQTIINNKRIMTIMTKSSIIQMIIIVIQVISKSDKWIETTFSCKLDFHHSRPLIEKASMNIHAKIKFRHPRIATTTILPTIIISRTQLKKNNLLHKKKIKAISVQKKFHQIRVKIKMPIINSNKTLMILIMIMNSLAIPKEFLLIITMPLLPISGEISLIYKMGAILNIIGKIDGTLNLIHNMMNDLACMNHVIQENIVVKEWWVKAKIEDKFMKILLNIWDIHQTMLIFIMACNSSIHQVNRWNFWWKE